MKSEVPLVEIVSLHRKEDGPVNGLFCSEVTAIASIRRRADRRGRLRFSFRDSRWLKTGTFSRRCVSPRMFCIEVPQFESTAVIDLPSPDGVGPHWNRRSPKELGRGRFNGGWTHARIPTVGVVRVTAMLHTEPSRGGVGVSSPQGIAASTRQ